MDNVLFGIVSVLYFWFVVKAKDESTISIPLNMTIQSSTRNGSVLVCPRKCSATSNTGSTTCSDEFFQITGCALDSDRNCTSCTIGDLVFNMNEWCNGSSSLRIQFGTHSCDEMFERMKNYISMVHHASTDTFSTTKPVSQFVTSELNSPVTAASEATSHMSSTSYIVATGTSVTMIPASTTTIKAPLSESQSLSNTSLTIGITVGAGGVIVAIMSIVLLICLRSKASNGNNVKSQKPINKDEAYIGSQNIAYPLVGNQSSEFTNLNIHGIDNNYLEINSVATIVQDLPYDYIDITDEHCTPEDKATASGNSDHASYDIVGSQCNMNNVISDSVHTEFNQPSSNTTVNMITEGLHDYSILDPEIAGYKRTKDDDNTYENTAHYAFLDHTDTYVNIFKAPDVKSTEAYAILDPRVTGFDRLKVKESAEDIYELAKPLTDDEDEETKILDEQTSIYQCNRSKVGDYNSVDDKWQNNKSEHIYNRCIDDVYDTANYKRPAIETNKTYDHIVPMKYGEDYDHVTRL